MCASERCSTRTGAEPVGRMRQLVLADREQIALDADAPDRSARADRPHRSESGEGGLGVRVRAALGALRAAVVHRDGRVAVHDRAGCRVGARGLALLSCGGVLGACPGLDVAEARDRRSLIALSSCLPATSGTAMPCPLLGLIVTVVPPRTRRRRGSARRRCPRPQRSRPPRRRSRRIQPRRACRRLVDAHADHAGQIAQDSRVRFESGWANASPP